MKPAYDGIGAWILILAALILGLTAPHIDGRTVLSLALLAGGVSLLTRTLNRLKNQS